MVTIGFSAFSTQPLNSSYAQQKSLKMWRHGEARNDLEFLRLLFSSAFQRFCRIGENVQGLNADC